VTGDTAGRFVVHGIPAGRLVLESGSNPQFIIQGSGVTAEAERALALVLDWGRYEIQGRVVDGGGNAVPVKQVALTWYHTRNGVRSTSSRATAADAQGRFRFTGLGPGPHTIFINAPGFEQTRIIHDVSRQGDQVLVRLAPRSATSRKASF
jgi:hypothetical protein